MSARHEGVDENGSRSRQGERQFGRPARVQRDTGSERIERSGRVVQTLRRNRHEESVAGRWCRSARVPTENIDADLAGGRCDEVDRATRNDHSIDSGLPEANRQHRQARHRPSAHTTTSAGRDDDRFDIGRND